MAPVSSLFLMFLISLFNPHFAFEQTERVFTL